jgi:uncharacterized membrane protein YqjE
MIEGNGHTKAGDFTQERVLGHSVSRLGTGVLTLMELQAELLQVDLKEWTSSFVKSMIALTVGLVLALASLPVLLMALGYFLSEATSLSLAASMLIAGVCGLVLALFVAGIGYAMLKNHKGMLRRFKAELRHNVRWLKEVLSRPTLASYTKR